MATDWVEPQTSRKQVRKAGEHLAKTKQGAAGRREPLSVMANWRSAHAYPMHALLMFVRQKALQVDKDATTAQRLKRATSVLLKLERFPTMKLDRMQDIAGCRVIVRNQSIAKKLRTAIIKSRTKNELHAQKDYVEEPKPSGYRGYHLIFKYQGRKREFNGLFVEVQLRTRTQHAWATAVEVVGTFIGKSLKTGEGHVDWDKFFQMAAAEFSYLEGEIAPSAETREKNRKELKKLSKSLNVEALLDAFSASANFMKQLSRSTAKNSFYLMRLDTTAGPKESKVEVWTYAQKDIDAANIHYGELEENHQNEPRVDVVLVAVDSVNSLHSAYPNYFADTRVFLEILSSAVSPSKQLLRSVDPQRNDGAVT